jgi:taurine--2-oxoglutarate transaminase
MVPTPYFYTWAAQKDGQPLHMTGGEGACFDTADGSRWLDMGSLSYQANLGHQHPRVVASIQAQAAELCMATPNADFPAKRQLAQKLLDLAPEGFTKVFFTLGGAEAVENALKIAKLATGRQKAISRYRSYHGASMGALSLTGDFRRPPLEPGIPGVVHALDCYCERCPFGQTLEHCKRECASHIGELLKLEGPGSVAAVFLEPIVGANGALIPPDDYLPMIRKACDDDGALLVLDEVLTGFGRTGKWFAFEHYDVVPDIITLGKGLTGGMAPLGAVLVHERVARHFDQNFLYAGLTHYAHPLGCAAAVASIKVYEDDQLIERSAKLGEMLLDGLKEIKARHADEISFVRGKGLFAAMEIEIDSADPFWGRLQHELEERCVFVHLRARNKTLLLAPPLVISDEYLNEGIQRVGQAIAAALG